MGARRPDGSPSSLSNYGSRVDASGWGESVWAPNVYCDSPSNPTCHNYPTATFPEYQIYTSSFGGTSAAAPIVAGAIIALQGLQKARGGLPFSPEIACELVRNIGSAQLPGKNIGKLPDIRAMHLWMIADADGDGVSNIDEMIMGRNPYFDERKLIPILLSDD